MNITKIESHRAIGYLCAIAATAIWSGNFIVARGLNTSIEPVSLAFWRWVVAVVCVLPFGLKAIIVEWKAIKRHIIYLLITAVFGVTLFNTLIYKAGQTTSAINLSLISLTFPVFVIVASRLCLNETITTKKVCGIAVVLFGILMLLTGGDFDKLRHLNLASGDGWMLLAAMSFAIYSLLLKFKPKELSVWSMQLSTFALGLLILTPAYLWTSHGQPNTTWEPTTLLSVIYIGVCASLVAFTLWNQAIINIGPVPSGMLYYSLPLFSGGLAFVFLDEPIGLIHLESALLIIAGIILANSRKA
ncbi:DMT family transporter [Vibrio sp.]|nr:DMT family transporter [Vibrio sp.]